jgi:hypothetical protein
LTWKENCDLLNGNLVTMKPKVWDFQRAWEVQLETQLEIARQLSGELRQLLQTREAGTERKDDPIRSD